MNDNNLWQNLQFIHSVAKKLRNPFFENVDLMPMYKIVHDEKLTEK